MWSWSGLCLILLWSWSGPGLILVKSWSDSSRILVGSCSGPDFVYVWCWSSPDLVWSWSNSGLNLLWSGPVLRTLPGPGLVSSERYSWFWHQSSSEHSDQTGGSWSLNSGSLQCERTQTLWRTEPGLWGKPPFYLTGEDLWGCRGTAPVKFYLPPVLVKKAGQHKPLPPEPEDLSWWAEVSDDSSSVFRKPLKYWWRLKFHKAPPPTSTPPGGLQEVWLLT